MFVIPSNSSCWYSRFTSCLNIHFNSKSKVDFCAKSRHKCVAGGNATSRSKERSPNPPKVAIVADEFSHSRIREKNQSQVSQSSVFCTDPAPASLRGAVVFHLSLLCSAPKGFSRCACVCRRVSSQSRTQKQQQQAAL